MEAALTIAVALTALGFAVGIALVRVMRLPADHPAAVGARGTRTERTVAFVGASIIHGRVSANLPDRVRVGLKARGSDVAIINAGINGDLAYNAWRRIEGVLACAPDDVIVLVGSNDVMGSLSRRAARRYRYGKRLPQMPDLDFYRASLTSLVDALVPRARVALCTLPPLGEDPASIENARVQTYNAVIREIAAARGVPLIDVNRALLDALGAAPGRAPLLGAAMLAPMLLRGAFGLKFSSIGRLFGFRLLVDGVHLTEPTADLVAGHLCTHLAAAAPRV